MRTFEATAFQPREVRHQAVQVVTETPDGTAAACANHSGNAAVTNCQRCGLFICALCEMNSGSGTFCPSCYERARTETQQGGGTRYRDYASMAVSGTIFSLLCWLIPIGPFVIYWGYKGIAQRRAEGVRPVGQIVCMVLGVVATLLMIGGYVAMIAAMVSDT
ncbi:MAG TPA: hypothetical protein VF266_09395 [Thermoanaerobaculia bacterium]